MSAPDSGDLDPVETLEWQDALKAVQQHRGDARANQLLNTVVDQARREGLYVPRSLTTAYKNTIAPEAEEKSPGDRAIEHRLRSIIRWNAMAIILRANKESSELGGHIASFQSAATLYDIGFGHFWHAPTATHGGDLLFIQGHSSPGIYARAFLEGRLSEDQLLNYRQETGGKGISSYPAPLADARLLAVPHRVDGPGAADGDLPGALPQVPARPRPGRNRAAQGLGLHGRRRDGRARKPGRHLAGRPREARQPDLRHQLQPAAPRRPGARQRQDRAGTRECVPRRRLERHQGVVGQRLGQAARQGQERIAAAAHGRVRRRRVSGLQEQERRLRARALLRQVRGAEGARRRHERRRDLEPHPRRARPREGVRRLCRGGQAHRPADA